MANNYLLLYRGGSMPANEAEQKKVMAAWDKWFAQIGTALVDGGNPFTPMAKVVDHHGMVSNLPQDMLMSGYSVIKADSLDEAVAMAKNCPVTLGGADIAVFETFNAMGM